MQGVRIIVDASDIAGLITRLMVLDTFDSEQLMTDISAIGESQTRRRIEEEKTAPDGTPWPPNAEGTSILLQTGRNLRDSVASGATAAQAEWGASWEFAHVHQDGAVISAKSAAGLRFNIGGTWRRAASVTIPARQFVGISAENATEIEAHTTDFLRGLLQ